VSQERIVRSRVVAVVRVGERSVRVGEGIADVRQSK
jgi:hypothetical protein